MRTYYVPTKCGRCIECRQQRQREWIVRLSEELEHKMKNWEIEQLKEKTEKQQEEIERLKNVD